MVLNFVKFELSDGDDSLFECQECRSVADFAINALPVMIRSNNRTSNMHNLMQFKFRIQPSFLTNRKADASHFKGRKLQFRDMWVPVITAWTVLRLPLEERAPVWRVVANILN